MSKRYQIHEKTKSLVKDQGSKHHDEEEKTLTKLTRVLYTRPLALPFECPNFVVFNLNGTPSAVRDSWRRAILYLRLWCFNNTDNRYQFGNHRSSSCMIPAHGKFFVYMHWSGKWLCAVIDGPSLYLDGYVTRSLGEKGEVKVRENDSAGRKGPILIEKSEALPWPGNYKGAYDCKLGYNGLLPAFKTMHDYVETGKCKSKKEDKVEMEGQTIILHLPEAARSDELYGDIDDSFLAGDKFGMKRLKAARRWSHESEKAEAVMQCRTLGADRKSWSGNEGNLPDMKTSKIIENIRLLYRPNHVHTMLLLRNMPVQLGLGGPVGDIWEMQNVIDSHMPSFQFLTERFSISGCTSSGNLDSEKNKMESGFTSNRKLDNRSAWSEKDSGFSSTGKSDMQITGTDTDKHTVNKAIANLFEENTATKGEAQEIVQYTPKTPKSSEVHGVGLYNLGQTCYMNSTIQCMHCIPELMDALASYARNDNGRHNWSDAWAHQLTVAAHDTFSALDTSTTPVSPSKFLEALREIYPIFAEREHNSYKHQDAEECWTVLLNTFSATLASKGSEPTAAGQLKGIFGITLVSRLDRAETGEYLKTQSVDLIRCPINDGVKHLHEVLDQSLKAGGSYYEKDSKIHELPRYFTIQLGRMYHDNKLNTMVKKFDRVNHALQLDLYEHCSDEMKLKLQAHREVSESNALGSLAMDIDQVDPIVPKKQCTGIYNLVAIVTHQGPTANRGHYVAWVKQSYDTWIQFSDAVTSTHEDKDILELSGGSDLEHVPYIYLYKAELT